VGFNKTGWMDANVMFRYRGSTYFNVQVFCTLWACATHTVHKSVCPCLFWRPCTTNICTSFPHSLNDSFMPKQIAPRKQLPQVHYKISENMISLVLSMPERTRNRINIVSRNEILGIVLDMPA